MAIEDAISISEVLGPCTSAAQVPERLKLYQDIRKERAEWARDQARINAMDEDVRPPSKCRGMLDLRRDRVLIDCLAQGGFVMLKVCHDHDEVNNSRERLEDWKKEEQGAGRSIDL